MLTQRILSRHVRASRHDFGPSEVLDWHDHRNLSFCFVIRGDYREATDRQSFTCRPGDVAIQPASVRHLNEFGQRGAVCVLLEISEEFLGTSAGSVETEFTGQVRNHQLARIGLELHEELRVADRLSPIMLEGIALRSLVSMLRLERGKSKQQEQVEAIRDMLDAGMLTEEVTQQYLYPGERRALRRLFSETQGCSINTYALSRRAFRAFDELLNTDHSLAEIALRCGFYDQAHFTKVFANFFGVTPGRLRSRVTHANNAHSHFSEA
jgi:AraC family transcriptional regulator